MVHHSNDDAMNKIPLKSGSGLDDEEKNGGELMQDTAAAEEARREQMRVNVLVWMKKLTIGIICFIGIALISYLFISLCFSDWPKSTPLRNNSSSIVATTAAPGTATATATAMATTLTAATEAVAAVTTSPTTTTTSNSNTKFSSTVEPTVEQLLPLSRTTKQLHNSNSRLGVFEQAAVCSDRQICSNVGSDILARSGSAVDATIATMLCNGLNTLENLGIGGGLMMNIYERATRQAYHVDANAMEPIATNPNVKQFINVPGEVMGFHVAYERFGKLPWRELVEPSLKICQTGFIMNKNQEIYLRKKWESIEDNSVRLQALKNFIDPISESPYKAGSLLKPPMQLCNTYQLLADNGPMDFYNGTVAKLLAEDLKELGSIITQDDLDAYSAELRLSVTMPLGKDTLYAVPPVSSGSVVSHILSILEGFNLTQADLADDESYARTIHRITEALKFGFAGRSELGNPHFDEVVRQLNNPEYAAQQRARINDSHVLRSTDYGVPVYGTEEPYTTSCLTIIAPNGDAVSATSSINSMRANMLAWMKKLTIGIICFIGIALICYVFISLCFSDWPKSTPLRNNSSSIVATTAAPGTATATATAMATTLTAATEAVAAVTPSPTTTTIATATAIETTTTSSTSSTRANITQNSIVATTTTTTTTTPTTTSNPSTSHTFITFTPTDEQSLPPTTEQNNDNIESTTTTATGDVAMAGPAVAASTSPTTPPPSTAPKLNKNQTFDSTLGVYEKAAVCSDSSPCSQVGSDILAQNGSAVDATIATMLCNGLLTAQSMGIGGGLLMNIYDRESRQGYQIDAHVVAPYAADAKMYDSHPDNSFLGPLSIAVPGEVMGYHLAHQRFGKLPWRDLVAPSLKLCETGYQMTKHQESSVRAAWSTIKDNPQYQTVFLNAETGEHYMEGELIKSPKKLCNTYQLLADNGPMDFYNGTVAKLLAEDLKELGSIITQDDLDAYSAELRLSVTMPLGKDTLYAVPPVSSGSVVSHILSILEGFNLTQADLADDESYARTIHRITEALKFGFARRNELGDPRFNEVRELVSQLNNPEYAAQQRAKINDSHVLDGPQEYGAQYGSQEDPYGTSQISVVAPNGDAVSVTSSINYYFGSGLIGPRTGIILNNGMNDFSLQNNQFELPPSPANTIDVHKRPMSSQSPMLLADHDGNIRLVIGAAGGSKIISAIVEVAARFLWLGEDLKTAVDAPRFYNQLSPDVLEYEGGKFPETVLQLLEKRGHKLKKLSDPVVSVVCAIGRNATAIYANADGRKRGNVAGF